MTHVFGLNDANQLNYIYQKPVEIKTAIIIFHHLLAKAHVKVI